MIPYQIFLLIMFPCFAETISLSIFTFLLLGTSSPLLVSGPTIYYLITEGMEFIDSTFTLLPEFLLAKIFGGSSAFYIIISSLNLTYFSYF